MIDGTTGQNGLSQARAFLEAANVTGIVVTKLDGTAKGGVILAIMREFDIPVKFVGVGESADDLIPLIRRLSRHAFRGGLRSGTTMSRYPFLKHVLVCTGARCNNENRGDERGELIRTELKDLNRSLGRKPTVRVCSVSCLDLCDYGPNMIIYPEGDVFSGLTRETAKGLP